MWEILIMNDSDIDFLTNLSEASSQEILDHFVNVVKVFDGLNSSACCTSGILPVESYDATNEMLSIHYHVDNDEEAIRVTRVDLD